MPVVILKVGRIMQTARWFCNPAIVTYRSFAFHRQFFS